MILPSYFQVSLEQRPRYGVATMCSGCNVELARAEQ